MVGLEEHSVEADNPNAGTYAAAAQAEEANSETRI